MFRNDGGNFGDNPFAKLLAKNGSLSNQDQDDMDAIPQNSMSMAMGSVSPVAGAENAEGQAAKDALDAELNTFGNTKVQPKNIIQDSTPLQAMPISSAPVNTGEAIPQGSEYFQKLLQMLNNK